MMGSLRLKSQKTISWGNQECWTLCRDHMSLHAPIYILAHDPGQRGPGHILGHAYHTPYIDTSFPSLVPAGAKYKLTYQLLTGMEKY